MARCAASLCCGLLVQMGPRGWKLSKNCCKRMLSWTGSRLCGPGFAAAAVRLKALLWQERMALASATGPVCRLALWLAAGCTALGFVGLEKRVAKAYPADVRGAPETLRYGDLLQSLELGPGVWRMLVRNPHQGSRGAGVKARPWFHPRYQKVPGSSPPTTNRF